MDAQALICDEAQHFSIQTVKLKALAPDEVLIRTLCSGVSIGTEFALIRNKLSWGPYPLCTGYMGTGEIEAVGGEVTGLEPGDAVYFRGNSPLTLADGTAVSSVSGTHCSHVVTKPDTTHGVALLPPGAPLEPASAFVMPAVGLHGVDMANPRLGQTVVVYGTGLIGLGVVAACAHRGCVVVAVDLDDARLDVARALGADHAINGSDADVAARVQQLAPGGADVVFECTGLPQCLDPAIALCRKFGTFVWQGNYGAKPVSLHFLSPHGRQLTMVFPCDDGLQPCRRAVLKNMAMGVLPWEKTLTHRVDYTDAPELYAQINAGADVLGAVIRWSEVGA